MSADYHLLTPIDIEDILKVKGITEYINDDTTVCDKCITDGDSFVWFWLNDQMEVTGATRYGGNDEDSIFDIIRSAIEDFDPRYIG